MKPIYLAVGSLALLGLAIVAMLDPWQVLGELTASSAGYLTKKSGLL
jgi:hypothetical protein